MSREKQKAFGIVEVLIASSIIVVILASLVGMGQLALSNSVRMQERAQATRLAQEGIEIVRQIRDTNWVDGNSVSEWNSWQHTNNTPNWSSASDGDYIVSFDSQNNYTAPHNQPDVMRFYLTSVTLAPDYSNAEAINLDGGVSKYKRWVNVASVSNLLPTNSGPTLSDYAKKITVSVDMPSGKTISISEMLTNWRPNY